MNWYPILGVVFRSILWTLVVFGIISCFFSAYRRLLHPRRRQEPAVGAASNGGGLPERGLLASEIEEFPKFVYPPDAETEIVTGVGIGRELTECAVCLTPFKAGETLRFITMCAHVFHAECVDVWLREHATCPCCRACLKLPSTSDTPV